MSKKKRDDEKKEPLVLKKLYVVIDGEKQFIDPEIIKKYQLKPGEITPFTQLQLQTDE